MQGIFTNALLRAPVFSPEVPRQVSSKDAVVSYQMRQSVSRAMERPERLKKAAVLRDVEPHPRVWYDAWENVNTVVHTATRMERYDLQRGAGSGYRLAPAGQAGLLSRPEAPICHGR